MKPFYACPMQRKHPLFLFSLIVKPYIYTNTYIFHYYCCSLPPPLHIFFLYNLLGLLFVLNGCIMLHIYCCSSYSIYCYFFLYIYIEKCIFLLLVFEQIYKNKTRKTVSIANTRNPRFKCTSLWLLISISI